MTGETTGKLRYDLDDTVHIQAGRDDDNVVVGVTTTRYKCLCGASFSGSGMDINGTRLMDEYQDGNVCERCMGRLRGREATIPGFMDEGEVVPHDG